jgi:two-component system sensor histidine kinase ChiS
LSALTDLLIHQAHKPWQCLFALSLGLFSILPLFHTIQAIADHTPHRVFSHILPDQLEAIGFINDITQDAQGFMWFAGANGLARHDGYSLTLYRNDSTDPLSLPHNHVSDLLATPEGELWITSRAGLQMYDPHQDGFLRYGFKGDLHATPLAHHVNQLWQDRKQRLWLATRSGLFEFVRATQEFRPVPLPGHAVSGDESLWTIAGDESGYLWLGHESGGVTRYHPDLNVFDLFRHQPENPQSLSSDKVRALYVDGRDRVWVGTLGGGLNRFDRDSAKFVRYTYDTGEKAGVVWDVHEDKNGAIWVGDGESASLLNVETGQFTRFHHRESQPETPGNYAVTSLFRDRAGDIWLGYFPSGVDRVDLRASVFRNLRHEPGENNSLADGNVNAVYEDTRGNLWIGSGLGLTYFNRQVHAFNRIRHLPGDSSTPSGSTVLSILEDYQGELWLGIWSGGLNRRDPVTGAYFYYETQPENPRSFWGREPWSILQDSRRDLWIATELGLNRYNRTSDDFTRFIPPPEMIEGQFSLNSRVVYEDSQNRLWWGTERGLFLLDRDTGQFTRFHHRASDSTSLAANIVKAIYEDRFGRLWVGTEGGGVSVMDRDGRSFTTYTAAQGLADNSVVGIKGDRTGAIWLATHRGLSRFDPGDNRFRNFDRRQGLPGNLFNRNAAVLTQAGELAFGNSKGLVLFDPAELVENDYVPPVVLTELQLFNQTVSPRQEKSPLGTHIATASQITLRRDQSVFSIRFAALNYRSSEDNQYAYRLLGFDADWNESGARRLATYTNLDPGEYHFEVRGANNDGVWNPQPSRIRVTVLAPLWATWWAYTIYCALAALLLGGAYYLYRTRLVAERHTVARERARVVRLTAQAQIQDDALALACHELRTPLQGMTGLAQALIDGAHGPLIDKARQDLGLIATGAQRMGRLIDDLTDLARLKHRILELHRQNLDLHSLVQSVLTLVRPLLGDKPIVLHNRVPQGLSINADPDRLQQILLNLLGNAARFTDQGEIGVTAVLFGRDLEIAVADTGVGMDASRLGALIKGKAGADETAGDRPGSAGLGLPLTQKLVELHGGRIEGQSHVGRGTVFRVLLPGAGDAVSSAISAVPQLPETEALQGWSSPRGAHILIVDDDPTSLRALHHTLRLCNYRVSVAHQGAQALAEVEKGDVDLVILDLNMVHLSGCDICRQIRQKHSARELPVLILTASSRLEDQRTAFEAGANDYLIKPATKEQLVARIAVLLRPAGGGV